MIGDRWKEMSRRVQIRGENVREYFHEKIHLCRMIGMSFYETKAQILEGLYSKYLSVYLLGRHHVNEDELLGDVTDYERLDASRSSRIRNTTDNKERDIQKSNVVRSSAVDTSKKDQPRITTTGTPIVRACFNCGSRTSFRPRRLSYSEQGSLRIIINELLAEGINRTSNSPYCSPIVLVKKKNNNFRPCVDYRELNKITVKDNFPTPLIDE